MNVNSRANELIVQARSTQLQIESRLLQLRTRYGHPLPGWLSEDPTILRLGQKIIAIEYELYGLAPDLTAEQLYPTELFIEDFFCS